jgi:hypothetical protein
MVCPLTKYVLHEPTTADVKAAGLAELLYNRLVKYFTVPPLHVDFGRTSDKVHGDLSQTAL